jgi:hypothetical protein
VRRMLFPPSLRGLIVAHRRIEYSATIDRLGPERQPPVLVDGIAVSLAVSRPLLRVVRNCAPDALPVDESFRQVVGDGSGRTAGRCSPTSQ